MRTKLDLMDAPLPLSGIACRHCGNIVVERGGCPMWFPYPDCLTDEAAKYYKRKQMIEKIEAYKTSDGDLGFEKEEAVRHNVAEFFKSKGHALEPVFYRFIVSNRAEIIRLLKERDE